MNSQSLFSIIFAPLRVALTAALFSLSGPSWAVPATLHFVSGDGATELVGYLWQPAGQGPFPAIVMLHGRAGPYSSAAKGHYDASTLSRRHVQWGEFMAARGYLALHVDSFGPRGYAQGFTIHSYRDRPAAVSEQTVRPLDAYGALALLRSRSDVIGDHIGVMGWSNGAMTVLAAMAHAPGDRPGFRAALALYPGCRAQEVQDYRPYAPLLVLLAGNDQEVSPAVCERMAIKTRARGAELDYVVYAGAQHAFDDPGSVRQSLAADRVASEDAQLRAEQFFARYLQVSKVSP